MGEAARSGVGGWSESADNDGEEEEEEVETGWLPGEISSRSLHGMYRSVADTFLFAT